MKKTNLLLTTCAVSLLTIGGAHAVTQGAAGATSTGTITIDMDVLEEVRITSLVDIALGAYTPGGGDLVGTSPVCVYYNNSVNYDLTLDSANTAGPGFQLNLAADNVPYVVEYQADTDGAGAFIGHTEATTVQYGFADPNNDDCATLLGPTSTIRATVTDTGAPLGVANGNYTDIITLTVAPNP